MGSGRSDDHYGTLFPRQDRLDLESPAEDDGQAVDEGSKAADGAGALPIEGSRFTESEQHRRECEARYVMKLAREQRQAYYAGVHDKRGEGAMLELIAEVNRQWAKVNG